MSHFELDFTERCNKIVIKYIIEILDEILKKI